jgi:pentatricopeptide repeat protein
MFSFRSACTAIAKQRIVTNQLYIVNASLRIFPSRYHSTRQQQNNLFRQALACTKNNQPEEALGHLQTMTSNNIRLGTDLCQELINCFIANKGLDSAAESICTIVELFGKRNYINRDSQLPYTIMEITATTNQRLETALKLHNLLTPYSISPTPAASKALLDIYQHYRETPDLWQKVSPTLTKQSYFLLYRALFNQQTATDDFFKTALALLKDLTQLGLKPSASIYHRVLVRVKRMRAKDYEAEWKAAFAPFTSSAIDTDQMTGKALELMYDGQFDKAKEMIKEIVDNKGDIPNTSAVTSMMEHAIQRRRFDVSHAIYSTVSGPISTLSPHRRQHAIQMISSMALIAYARSNNPHGALTCYKHMTRYDIMPTADGLGALVQCLSKDGDIQEVYENAKRYQVKLTPYFFNALISHFAKKKQYKRSIEVFEDMKQMGISPNQITFASMISACVRVKAESQALSYFDAMVKADQVSVSALNSMMKFYSKKKERARALRYYTLYEKYNLSPNTHTYRLLMELYAPDSIQKARSVLRSMEENGVRPEATHYAFLINEYGSRKRDLPSALELYNEMTLAGVEPDDNLYQVIANVYSKNGDYQKAQEFRFKIVK